MIGAYGEKNFMKFIVLFSDTGFIITTGEYSELIKEYYGEKVEYIELNPYDTYSVNLVTDTVKDFSTVKLLRAFNICLVCKEDMGDLFLPIPEENDSFIGIHHRSDPDGENFKRFKICKNCHSAILV